MTLVERETAAVSRYQSSETLLCLCSLTWIWSLLFYVETDPSWFWQEYISKIVSGSRPCFHKEKNMYPPVFLTTYSLDRDLHSHFKQVPFPLTHSCKHLGDPRLGCIGIKNNAVPQTGIPRPETYGVILQNNWMSFSCWRLPSITMTIETQLVIT